MATTIDEATIARDANRRIRRSGNIAGWTFAGPSVFIVLGLSFIPMIWAGYLSLTDSNLLSAGHFIGLANYSALAKDPMLRQAFTNTFLLAVMYLPIGLAAGLGVAILLLIYRRFKDDDEHLNLGFWLQSIIPLGAAAVAMISVYVADPAWGAEPVIAFFTLAGTAIGAAGLKSLLDAGAGRKS